MPIMPTMAHYPPPSTLTQYDCSQSDIQPILRHRGFNLDDYLHNGVDYPACGRIRGGGPLMQEHNIEEPGPGYGGRDRKKKEELFLRA